ncbi:E3 ubiquitin-protein ligase Praja-2 isoform X2 [Pseudophryne corroboree]|uniref:E3 ubiquitin-protein ligase Praja-2 isoform X2 n=1 Tax=Pseudophryne corroboree TaxID=495146 RepID=UPI003081D794
MGQEACKAAWPKPSGGYQTITGRRYGRRHAYISFRPSLESPNRTSAQLGRETEGMELDNVQKEKELILSESPDSSLFTIGSVLTADFQEESRTFHANDSLSVFTEAEQNTVSPFSMSEHVRRCQTLNNSTDCEKSTKTFIRHASMEHSRHSHQNSISFVNIDSFEPDSSEGEDTVSHHDDISLNCETGNHKKTLNHMLSDFKKESPTEILSEFSSLNHTFSKDSLSQVRPASLAKQYNIDLCTTPWSLSASSVSEDEATGVGNMNLCDSLQLKHRHELAQKSTIGLCNEINTVSVKTEHENEPVVRPKIRKQVPSISTGKDPLITEEIGKETKSSRKGNRETIFSVEKMDEKNHNVKDPTTIEGARKKIKRGNKENVTPQEDKPLVDDTFWDDFEVYGMKLTDSTKDEDSSDCSDGEWSTCLPSYFSGDKDLSSGDESWETLPGKEEHEVQSISSSLEEENSEFCFQVEEQNSLEDGEIPWLQYHEDIESSTDEENEIGSHYLPPGFFILDGNNNLEDDSSMSEDLEVEWRLLDDFGDGIGVAQAMSYMDPQFLTYMALEERLAQAMETALAHLESLAVDVEQAHPPATKESIECLPQIIITDDHNSQEQCCAICCSEYIKDEILTELPCHHLFHKPCVTLWLQKSGTCPVCRHVLASLLPEAAAATSFLSDHDSPPSIHNAAGTR